MVIDSLTLSNYKMIARGGLVASKNLSQKIWCDTLVALQIIVGKILNR